MDSIVRCPEKCGDLLVEGAVAISILSTVVFVLMFKQKSGYKIIVKQTRVIILGLAFGITPTVQVKKLFL